MMDEIIRRQDALEAINRIWDRCEEIEAHLPDGDPDKTGYKMIEDYLTVWKYLSAQPEQTRTQMSLANCISRQAAIDAIEFGITYAKAINRETGEVRELFQASNNELRKAADRIKQLPSAQPERKVGKWIEKSREVDSHTEWWYKCSECGEEPLKAEPSSGYYLTKYCPNCGAKMEGDSE